MLNIGDTVMVKGKTMVGDEIKEPIMIGTICRVVGIENNEKEGLSVCIIPENSFYSGYGEYWYFASDVEKGHWEWIKDE